MTYKLKVIAATTLLFISCSRYVATFSGENFGKEIPPGIYTAKNGEDMFSGPRVIVEIVASDSGSQYSSCFTFKNAPIRGTVIRGKLSRLNLRDRVTYSSEQGMVWQNDGKLYFQQIGYEGVYIIELKRSAPLTGKNLGCTDFTELNTQVLDDSIIRHELPDSLKKLQYNRK